MINLIFNYYESSDNNRNKELNHCLLKNIENTLIDNIILLNETSYIPKRKGLINISSKGRVNYSTFFNLLNQNSGDDDINILINSDCFFDTNNFNYIHNIKKEECWCLSRWDVVSDSVPAKIEPFIRLDSQDAWIFRGKIKDLKYCDFSLGVPGCDNRIAHEIGECGYILKNPMFDITLVHYHMSNLRNYPKNLKIDPPYKYVHPIINNKKVLFKNI